MEYFFFGPYWLFCVVRAVMTASYGSPQYGAFKNGDGLVVGFFGAVVWFFLLLVAVYLLIVLPTEAVLRRNEEEEQL